MGVVSFASERQLRRPEPPDLISSCRECGDTSSHVCFPRVDHRRRVEAWPAPYGLCDEHAAAASAAQQQAHG